jgi:Ca2+-dependent lipid-binding protein
MHTHMRVYKQTHEHVHDTAMRLQSLRVYLFSLVVEWYSMHNLFNTLVLSYLFSKQHTQLTNVFGSAYTCLYILVCLCTLHTRCNSHTHYFRHR